MSDKLIHSVLSLLDWLAPETAPVSREERRRARSMVAAALIGTAILGTTAVSTLTLGLDWRLAYLNFAWAAAIIALLGVAKLLESPALLANALVALGFSHTLLLSALAGGRNIGALFAFAVFPLVAVLLAGWRSGLIFTALSAAAVVCTSYVPVEFLAPRYLGTVPVAGELTRDALNVVFAIGLLSALYDVVRSSTLSDAEQARRHAEESSARARIAGDRQKLLIDLSRRLHAPTIDTFRAELSRAMEHAASLAGADRTVLRLLDDFDATGRFSWGEDPQMPRVAQINVGELLRSFRWSTALIASGRTMQVRRLDELPPEAADERAYLESRGVVSWLCVPIRAGQTSIGFQAFETTAEEKVWDEEEIAALRLMTELFSSTIQRNRIERALRDSESKFAAAFRDHPDAMVITDLATDEIIECNEQWLREAARPTREDVIGRRLWDFEFKLPVEWRESIRRALLESGELPAIEVPVVGSLGEHRTFLISATRIGIGGRTCALSNIHDLTARKQLEHQLLHAQKMEAVGRLAGGIAHDFNNMLTVISGYSASLMADLEGELFDDAAEIHQAARRSADLTRQLLAFSRRQVLQTEILDSNALVSGLESMLRPLIGESVELRFDLLSDAATVKSDRGQLEQAVVNLVVNARDAMPDGGVLTVQTSRVEITTRPEAAPVELVPGEYVVITVSDEGRGIDPELAEHVMEPFYTTKPAGEGTGLGLPMVHGLARQCGGGLVLDSEPGRGTRAHIYLPACADEDAVSGPAAHAPRAPRGAPKGSRILLVEDEETVRRLASRTLRAAGYTVVEVDNGEDALQRVLHLGDDIDLVLSDVVMPKLSGIELVRRLRIVRPGLPVVLMSGYPAAAEGRPIPEDVVLLPKPFEPSALCDVVDRVLLEKESSAREVD
jgi:PAS domain S-box-containing protein